MRRAILGIGLLVLGAWLCSLNGASPVKAQFNGCKPGLCNVGVASGSSYTGPGDIQTYAFWGGFRGYSAAYAAPGTNPAIDVCDSATGLTCSTIKILSTGALDSATLASSAACATACQVKTLYDQSGNGNNVPWQSATGGPIVTASALNSSYCMHNDLGQYLMGAHNYTQAQTYSMTGIYKNSSSNGEIINMATSGYVGAFVETRTGGTAVSGYAGSNVNVTVSATTFHAFQYVFNGASSAYNVDGTDATSQSAGSDSITAQPIATSGPDGPLVGTICELGFVAGSISTGNRSSLNTNMHAAYGGF